MYQKYKTKTKKQVEGNSGCYPVPVARDVIRLRLRLMDECGTLIEEISGTRPQFPILGSRAWQLDRCTDWLCFTERKVLQGVTRGSSCSVVNWLPGCGVLLPH